MVYEVGLRKHSSIRDHVSFVFIAVAICYRGRSEEKVSNRARRLPRIDGSVIESDGSSLHLRTSEARKDVIRKQCGFLG
jgi:hypothetical protein